MKTLTVKQIEKAEKAEEIANALKTLKQYIKAGDTVTTILKHVSRSGMSRSIDLMIIRDGEPWNITYFVARVMNDHIDEKHGGIKVGGCGMDMGWHLVYSLSHVLFKDGFFCTGSKDCPANDHNNERWDNAKGIPIKSDYSLYRQHSDVGYALRQRWI